MDCGLDSIYFDSPKLSIKLIEEKNKRNRSSRSEVFLRKGVLKICSKFKGEHPC